MNNQEIRLLINIPEVDDPASILARWQVPTHLERDGMFLKYKPQEGMYTGYPGKKTMDQLIAEFAGLHSSKEPGIAILDFARRWGVLGLCKHDRPVRHLCYASPFNKPCRTKKRGSWCYEPLAGWMIYSQLIAALLRVGDFVAGMAEAPLSLNFRREGEVVYGSPSRKAWDESASLEAFNLPGELEDWAIINRYISLTGTPILSPSVFTTNAQAARIILMYAMLPLLREPGVQLNFSWWNTKRPTFFLAGETNEFGHGGLFGALAIYTMLSLSLAKRLVKCRECPEFFLLPVGRRRNTLVCPTCVQRLSHLEAVKRYTERERQNPNRTKRRRLTPAQREAVKIAMGEGKPGTAQRLAKKYGVSVRAIYKIGSTSEQHPRKGEGS